MEVMIKDNVYHIKENLRSWTLTRKENKITITCNISKELCGSVEELKAYLKQNIII